MKLGYTNETDLKKRQAQIQLLKENGCERVFQTSQYNKMLKLLKKDDNVLIISIKAINHTTRELIRIMITLSEKGVLTNFLEDKLTIYPNSDIVNVFSKLYHSSNENFRIFAGGRPPGPTVPLNVIKKVQKMYEEGVTKTELCKKLDISAPTLDRYLKINILEKIGV